MTDWAASDLILFDRYSTPRTRRALLLQLAEHVGKPCGYFTYSPFYVLPSLSDLVVDAIVGDGRHLVKAVVERARGGSGESNSPADVMATVIGNVLPGVSTAAVTRPPIGYGNLGVSVLWPHASGPLDEQRNAIAHDLAVAVLGSVIAASHREVALGVAMERTLRTAARGLPADADPLHGDHLERRRVRAAELGQRDLLTLLCDELQAEGACVYELVGAELVAAQSQGDRSWFPNRLAKSSEGLVSAEASVEVRRYPSLAALCWDAYAKRQRLLGNVQPYECVVVPYGYLPGNQWLPGGVLAVAKTCAAAGTAYGAKDLSLLRSVATHGTRSASEQRWFGTVARLAERVADAASPREGADPLQPHVSALLKERRDARLVAPLVRGILDDLMATTRALCATFRLVVAGGPHLGTRTLARLAYSGTDADVLASPPEIRMDSPPTRSVNGWVAWHGRPCYLPQLPDLPDGGLLADAGAGVGGWNTGYPGLTGALQLRPEVHSELCIPVFTEARLVGTINMESGVRRSFDDSAHAVDEYAQLAGLAIMLARREISVEMLEAAGGFLDKRHALEAQIADAIGLLRNDGEGSSLDDRASRAIYSMARARALIRRAGRGNPERAAEGSMIIREIVDAEAESLGRLKGQKLSSGILAVSGSSAIELLELRCIFSHGRALRFALRQVLNNAFDHGLQDDTYGHRRPRGWQRDIAISVAATYIGGVQNVVIGVMSSSLNIDRARAAKVFREPLTKLGGRVCLGAFLAGEAMRRVGGAAAFRVLGETEDGVATVVAELAVPASQQ